MQKSKFLTILIIVLLLVNVTMVAMLFFGNPNKRHEKPREIIIRELHFDANQIKKYDVLIKNHQKSIIKLDDEIFKLKSNLYEGLNSDTKNKASLIGLISEKQAEIENIHYNHLLDIKKLCHTEQLADYDSLTRKFSKLFNKLPSRRNEKR